jgi:prepilin-type N-terminal cleavage/methylation domain-containing protein
MNWTIKRRFSAANRASGFTLIELLAAMVFMAIVIPVTLQGLQIASRASEVAVRKAVATRVLDSVMNEYVANAANRTATQKGVVTEGSLDYNWLIRLENWKEDSMRLVTAEVTYKVRGQDYRITASTLTSLTTQ